MLAKVGLDGHDRGVKVVARGLRDSGFQVIYSGIWQSPSAVAQAVADEDADWLGISLLSGAHMTLVPQVLAELRDHRLDDVRVALGGIIPENDTVKLREMGVSAVFGPGSTIHEIADSLTAPAVERADISNLVHECAQHDRRALARLLTLLTRRESVDAIGEELRRAAGDCTSPATTARPIRTVAFTGSPGVGKSSLIAQLLVELRRRDLSVAVLACDPQSPLTGGALLGDRVRMTECLPDPKVFIRSLAVPSGSQGIAAHLDRMIGALQRFGFDVILIETAGIGQGDVAVRNVADVLVVLLQPEAGDAVQWEKAGLLEVADLVVIHKSDLPGAERTQSELCEHLNLPGCRDVPIVRVSATRKQGLRELWEAIESRAKR